MVIIGLWFSLPSDVGLNNRRTVKDWPDRGTPWIVTEGPASKGFPFRRRVLRGTCQGPGVKTDPEPGRAAPAERNRWVATRDEPVQSPQVWRAGKVTGKPEARGPSERIWAQGRRQAQAPEPQGSSAEV